MKFSPRFESSLVGAALENVFSRYHVPLPVVVASDMEIEGVAEKVEQAEEIETEEEKKLKQFEESLQPPPEKPRANVKQLQRPRKRPRRCDVCEKDFKSVGKMQAHRYDRRMWGLWLASPKTFISGILSAMSCKSSLLTFFFSQLIQKSHLFLMPSKNLQRMRFK